MQNILIGTVIHILLRFDHDFQAIKYRPLFWDGDQIHPNIKNNLCGIAKLYAESKAKASDRKDIIGIVCRADLYADTFDDEYMEWISLIVSAVCPIETSDDVEELLQSPILPIPCVKG